MTKSKDSKAAASKEADKPAEDKVAEPKLAEAKPASTKEEEKEKSTSKDATNGEKPASANRGVLKLGSGLPKIVLQNEDGEDVDVSTLAGERGVVFFLYPRVSSQNQRWIVIAKPSRPTLQAARTRRVDSATSMLRSESSAMTFMASARTSLLLSSGWVLCSCS